MRFARFAKGGPTREEVAEGLDRAQSGPLSTGRPLAGAIQSDAGYAGDSKIEGISANGGDETQRRGFFDDSQGPPRSSRSLRIDSERCRELGRKSQGGRCDRR